MSDESATDVTLKAFDRPDEVRTFEKGRFEIVRIGGTVVGRATYEPGWRAAPSSTSASWSAASRRSRSRTAA